MVKSASTEEFIGRFGISYKDGKIIYVYDEITHGLYKFELGARKVNLVLTPKDIHRNKIDKIRGISKSGNEIILIPSYLNSEWVFYNKENGKIRYKTPIKEKIRISGAVTVKETLYLIPFDIYNPLTIISLEDENKISLYNGWFSKDNLGNEVYYVWGAFSYNHTVAFPIVNSKQIIYINNKEVKPIEVEIPNPIHSICVYEDEFWVLPVIGKRLYMVNVKGNILKEINLSIEGMELSASDFVRVIATKESVFLLPQNGKSIFVYQKRTNQIVQIEGEGECLPGELFAQSHSVTPYWDFVIEDKMLHLLPSNERYKRIRLPGLWHSECKLWYGDNINHNMYWQMIASAKKACIFSEGGKGEDTLNEFFEFTRYSLEERSRKDNIKIGEQIWGLVK